MQEGAKNETRTEVFWLQICILPTRLFWGVEGRERDVDWQFFNFPHDTYGHTWSMLHTIPFQQTHIHVHTDTARLYISFFLHMGPFLLYVLLEKVKHLKNLSRESRDRVKGFWKHLLYKNSIQSKSSKAVSFKHWYSLLISSHLQGFLSSALVLLLPT